MMPCHDRLHTVKHLAINYHFLSNKTLPVFILPTKTQTTSKINKKKKISLISFRIAMYLGFFMIFCDILLVIYLHCKLNHKKNQSNQFVFCQIRICILSNYRPVYRLTDLISRVSTNFGFIEQRSPRYGQGHLREQVQVI